MRRVLICLVFFLLSACGTLRPAQPPVVAPPPTTAVQPIPAGKAEVHIYRRAIGLGPLVLSIYDGAHPLVALPVGTYFQYFADPGPRALRAIGPSIGSIPYATTFLPGHRYFFSVYFLGDPQHGNTSLSPVDAIKAADQMASLKPATP